jgi:hypothetical protein
MAETEDFDHFTEVPTALLRQAIACMSYDAKRGYQGNATKYADCRHGTSRALADFTEIGYTDYPEVIDHFPEDLFEGLEE